MSEEKKQLLQTIGDTELFLQKNAGQLIVELHKLLQLAVAASAEFFREKVEQLPEDSARQEVDGY